MLLAPWLVAAILLQDTPTALGGQQRPAVPSSVDDPPALEEVLVEGRPTREAAQAYVDAVGVAPRGARLARWTGPVCVSVVGLRSALAQAIVDRIAVVTQEVGLQAGEPGCTPNVVVIATDDGSAMADTVVARERGRFRPGIDNSNLGLAALRRFRTSDVPVRWWHTSAAVFADSGRMAGRYRGGPAPGASAVAAGGVASETAVRNPSRMTSAVRHDLNSVTVIVDMDQVAGISFPALVDYIALLALAQVDPEADIAGQPTVLNLFADREGIDGLTDWDWDYLRALYSVRVDRPTSQAQEGEVAAGLARHRRERQGVAPDSEAD